MSQASSGYSGPLEPDMAALEADPVVIAGIERLRECGVTWGETGALTPLLDRLFNGEARRADPGVAFLLVTQPFGHDQAKVVGNMENAAEVLFTLAMRMGDSAFMQAFVRALEMLFGPSKSVDELVKAMSNVQGGSSERA